ncbi:exodeoxyribonuclease I [Pseudohalioglobus lutimaris]|uniref:Exodeoxyribonuclease I n=1 Tax=Pseudohalioglobus lutimaris TaxID=1737061 RepID=A0A2N5WZ03_9GAMM|nr:exodeoxyribonuclease I [Pseudohalioglobus lutimaris]PLW67458.1 exodeoxyribonuclease I [Pseudohalioglobus lutimaris]
MPDTFYWHDYETFGAVPSRDRPVQFAGLRTDEDLNPIGEPLVIFCRPANDFLPHPQACLITGISPQQALSEGIPEAEFISRIHAELAQPGTCGVGYNSLRFDDEVTRYTLYRNFYDPYAREWQNGNSRWDIIDMVRACHALRPEGIVWPNREDGLPSFRLEQLTAANGIAHEAAHDALSDVHATIAMARLIREKQPRLYDYVLRNRDKGSVSAMLDMEAMKPVLHVSGMFGAQRNNIALIVPLAMHPGNKNEVICYDLMADPAALIEASPELLREHLYTRTEDLPEGVERPGLKTLHINRCPVLVTAKMANPETAARLGISGDQCRTHLAALRKFRAADPQSFVKKMQAVYAGHQYPEITDPDRMLYSGGFFSDRDKRLMDQVRDSAPQDLASTSFPFEDDRLPEMLFRYRARNYPQSLSTEEQAQWEEYRFQRLTEADAGASICMEEYQQTIETLMASGELSPPQRQLMEQLLEYSDSLLA